MIVVLKIEVILYILFRVYDQLAVATLDTWYTNHYISLRSSLVVDSRADRWSSTTAKIVGRRLMIYLIDRVNKELFKKIMLWSLDDTTVDYAPPTEISLPFLKIKFF